METMLENLCAPTNGVRLLWTGNDGWLIWNGEQLIGIDLDFTNPLRRQPPAVELRAVAERLALHLISHEHEDHFSRDTCRVLLEEGGCQFAVPKSCADKAAELGIPPHRMRLVSPGGNFTAAGAEVQCVRAVHGHTGGSVYSGATMQDCGYRFRFGGLCFYEPGDTLLLEEHGEMEPVDVLFVSPTEHNTWIENSARLIAQLKPERILLQHFGTYEERESNRFWTHGYVQELLGILPPEVQKRVCVPTQSSVIEIAE